MAIPPKEKISGLILPQGKRVAFYGDNATKLSLLVEKVPNLRPLLAKREHYFDIPILALQFVALGAHSNGWILTIE